MEDGKTYWFANSEEDKPYNKLTCYRCLKLEEFLEKVEKENKIVGMNVEGNNICFILDDKDE